MRSNTIKKLCLTGVLIAICVLVTAYVSIPLAVTGNINMGDCVIMVSCMLMGLWYAPAVGAISGTIADLISGYAAYAPVTFIAKFLLATLFCVMCRKKVNIFNCILGIVIGGIAMVGCYFLYELLLYGAPVSALNVPFNLLQVGVNGIVALLLYPVVNKARKLVIEH